MVKILLLATLPTFILAMHALADEQATSQALEAVVDHVVDGDSLVLRQGSRQLTVRLEGIDAPELLQIFGNAARSALATALPSETPVTLAPSGIDKYGRTLAHLYAAKVGKQPLSAWLVEHGYAWHFAKYNKDPALKDAQESARKQKRGLWQFSRPTPPWEFRIQVDRGEVMPPAVPVPERAKACR